MLVIGLILLLLGAGLGAAAFFAVNDETGLIHLTVLSFERDTRPIELIGLGIAATLLFCLGWACMAGSIRRRARARRDERETERLTDLELAADVKRAESEARFEQAGLRDEDLRRREAALTSRFQELEAREAEQYQRETQWQQQVGPSVADVVSGRAQGNVAEGTAHWPDPNAR